MALPSGPNQGNGLPQRPNLPQRPVAPTGGQGGGLPDLPQRSQLGQGANDLAKSLRESAAPLPPAGDLTSNDRLGNYDFEGQKVARPSQNTYDDVDPFESLAPSQAILDDEEPVRQQKYTPAPVEEPEEFEPAPRTNRQNRDAVEFNKRNGRVSKEDDPIKPQAGKLDRKGQNVHIDEDKKKLKPFGGKKSLKVADLDKRKNVRSQARTVQTVLILLLVAIVGFGAYNAIVPKATLTTDDVRETVQQTVAMTDFPIEGGQGYAKDFMQAYFTMGTDPSAQTVLNYYYSGRMVPGTQNYPNRTNSKGYGQTILYGPTIYGSTYLTDSSANFTVGALIQPEDTTTGQVDASGNPVTTSVPDGSTAEWQFFSVNVYYNAETQQYSVTPDSPTLVPKPQNLASSKAPEGAAVGTGEEIEDQAVVKATVQGFMEGYRTSTPEDHIRLDQYLKAEPGVELLNGLGSSYEFANEGVDGAVTYVAYATTTTEIKVLVKAVWEYQYTDTVTTTYNSQYIMTLEPSSTGYVVTKFAPYYYTPEVE